jgi:nascent polypeptide-associated complex subunit alpha
MTETKVDTKTTEIDDLPPLEEAAPVATTTETTEPHVDAEDKSSRSEKKSRKAMAKLGLKEFSGVKLVQIKQKTNMITVQNPEVYKSAGDTFIIYGVPQTQEIGRNSLPQASKIDALKEQLKQLQKKMGKEEKNPVEVEAPVDETGIDAKDVELILKQVEGISRSKAVEALKATGGDLVNAIMSLTGV